MSDGSMIVLNCTFHVVSLVGLSAFIVFLYGRENSIVHTWSRWRSGVLKAALALVTGGHLLAAFSDRPAPVGEVLLNGGLALLWAWAAVFHHARFVRVGAFKKETS